MLPIFSPCMLNAAPGDLDSTFGTAGKAIFSFSAGSDDVNVVKVQADGKILVGGVAGNDFALARLTTAGILDTTFGTGGRVTTDIAGFSDQISGLAVQSDGKIIAAGQSYNISGDVMDIALVRYNTNGSVDTTFGTSGKVISNFASTDWISDVVLQTDGKMVVAGSINDGTGSRFLVARYGTNGAIDTTFGTAGKVVTTVGGGNCAASHVMLQPDGKIVVVGTAFAFSSAGVVRYLATGALDTSFGTGGIAYASTGYGEAAALQADGKILVAGQGGSFQNQFAIARLLPDGQEDLSFGYNGHVYTPVGTTSAAPREILFRSDWKIVVVGHSTSGSAIDYALARYHPNGSLDTGFGTGGKVITSMSVSNDYAFCGALQSDGKILAAGAVSDFADIGVARFDGGGTANYSPPAVVTTAATSVTVSSSTLNGTVNPSGTATTASFEYGLTTSYGSTAAVTLSPNTGTSNIAATANLTGLMPSTTYHFRMVASNSGGTAMTADATFTTATPTPEIGLFAGPTTASPAVSDGTSMLVKYGVTLLGVPLDRSFTVQNTGTANLQLTGLTLPAGFELVGGGALSATVPPASTYTFAVRFLANTVHGSFSGTFSLANNDSNEGSYDIPLQASSMGQGGGSRDLTFGANGGVTTDFSGTADLGYGVAVQGDGKIVMAGYSRVSSTDDFAVVRYLAGGGLDTSFGTGGKVTTSIGTATDRGHAIAIQSDGKILVAGYARIGSTEDFAVVRYQTDGSLDSTFGTGGKVTFPIGTSTDQALGIAVQGDGKIVLSGYASISGNIDFALVRCQSDGSLDTGFGTGGKVITPIGTSEDFCRSLTIQGDGKIVAAGHAYMGSASNDFAIVRYNANGSLDTTFGNGAGKVTVDIASNSADSAYSVVIQSDGKIVAGGETSSAFALIRCLADGSLDNGFGTGGRATLALAAFTSHSGRAVALEPNGKLLIAGNSYNGSNQDVTLMRANADGSLDTSFGDGGKMVTPVGTSNDYSTCMALKVDGTIVLGGYSTIGSGFDFTVLQYNGGTQVYPSPSVVTQAASGILGNAATLNGMVNPNGIITSTWFEYGLSTSYGSSTTAQSQGYGSAAVNVARSISGLTTGVLYHYRLVAQNGENTAYGADMTFTTAAGGAAQQAFNNAMTAANLTGPDAELYAIPFDDGVENLLKYAFNMNLSGPDIRTMNAGGGAGLPAISQQGSGPAGIFRFEFVRRIGSGLIYTPKKGESLTALSWTPLTDTPTVTPIDANWERVIYEEPVDLSVVLRCFGIVEISLP